MKYWVWGLCTLAALAGCDDDDAAAAMGDGDAEIRGLQTGSSGRDMAVFTQPGSPTTIGVDAAVDTPGNPGGDTAPGNGPMGGGAATVRPVAIDGDCAAARPVHAPPLGSAAARAHAAEAWSSCPHPL